MAGAVAVVDETILEGAALEGAALEGAAVQDGSLLEGDQYILDETELWGASFLDGVALAVAAVLNIKHHCTGVNSISRLRSQPPEILYIFKLSI